MTSSTGHAQEAGRLRRWVLRALGTCALTVCGLAGGVGLASAASALGGVDDLLGDTANAMAGAVTEVAEPLAQVVDQAAAPVAAVTAPVTPVLEQVTTPVTPVVAEVTEPVVEIVMPVTEPVIEPVIELVSPVTTAVATAVEPVTDPLLDAAAPVLRPLEEVLTPVLDPVLPVTVPELPGLAGAGEPATSAGVLVGAAVLPAFATSAAHLAVALVAGDGSVLRSWVDGVLRGLVQSFPAALPEVGATALALGGGAAEAAPGASGSGVGAGSPLRSAESEAAVLAFLTLVVLSSWMLASAATRTALPSTFSEVPVDPA